MAKKKKEVIHFNCMFPDNRAHFLIFSWCDIRLHTRGIKVRAAYNSFPFAFLNESYRILNVRNWSLHFPVAFKMPLTLEMNHLTVNRGCGDWINFHIWIWVEGSSARGREACMDHLGAAKGSDDVSSMPSSEGAHPGGQAGPGSKRGTDLGGEPKPHGEKC